MRLKNKKTGEIVDFVKGNFISSKDYGFVVYKDGDRGIKYNSLAELNEEWEDVPEEPKKPYYSLNLVGDVDKIMPLEYEDTEYGKKMEELGNHFDTKEEAEKAVEKLKAWKRLKDKGFKFVGNGVGLHTLRYAYEGEWCLIVEDFNLLFGGEE